MVIVEGKGALVECRRQREQFVDAYKGKNRWTLTFRDRGVGDDAGAWGEVVTVGPRRVDAWTTRDLDSAARWDFHRS